MQTASFKSTTLQSSTAVANALSASEISLNGADVVQSIQEKSGKALKNLISRELVNDEDYYIIWDDSGQPLDVKLPEGYCPALDFCTGLKEWKWDLSSVTSLYMAFRECSNLHYFNVNTSNVTNAYQTFVNANKLSSFTSDFSKVKNATYAFSGCRSLQIFQSELSSLTSALGMFAYCKLDKPSVQRIINCLRTTNVLTTTGNITIGIDKALANDSEFLAFLGIETGTNQPITITPPIRTLEDGTTVGGGTWTVQLQFN